MSNPEHTSRPSMATLPGSRRTAVADARRRADVDSAEHATISIRLRRRPDAPDNLVGGMSREAFADRYGADPRDIAAVEAFAQQAGLTVAYTSIARRTVQVTGTLGELSAAFNVTLGIYDGPDGSYRGREGDIHVPEALASAVEGVFGLDNRRLARPHIAMDKYIQGVPGPVQSTPPTIPGSLTPHEVAGLYGFPSNDAAGQTIGILEFGGGFAPSDVTGYFTGYDLAVPSVTAVGVDGATNSPGGDDYTVETALDIACAGSAAPGADIVVYFAPWSEQGWVDVVTTAVHDTTNRISTLTISYGWPEDGTIAGLTWSAAAIAAVSQTFAEAAALGISVFVSSGDHGASCGVNSFACVEYPGSDAWVTSCGGTTISAVASGNFDETVWNEGGGWATGGGVSAIVAPQSYQDWSSVPSSLHDGSAGRGVPDVAGNAAQSSGYPLYVNGNWTGAVGGTSAVAPLYAGLAAVLNAAVGEPVGFLNPLLYANARTGVFRDITSGDNTIDAVAGYAAGTAGPRRGETRCGCGRTTARRRHLGGG